MNRPAFNVKSITKSKRFVQQRERNRTKPCSNSAAKFFNLLQSLRTLALIWPQEFHKKNSPFHQKLYEVALPFLNERSVTATLGACWKTASPTEEAQSGWWRDASFSGDGQERLHDPNLGVCVMEATLRCLESLAMSGIGTFHSSATRLTLLAAITNFGLRSRRRLEAMRLRAWALFFGDS